MFKFVPLTVLAVALLSCANAASVYDKDGNILYLDGRVQSVLSSGNHNNAKEIESALQNSSDISIGGKSKLNDWISATASPLWEVSDASSYRTFNASDMYGTKSVKPKYYSVYRVDQLQYGFAGEGFHTKLGILSSQNQAKVASSLIGYFDRAEGFAVDSGINLALGYTFDDVFLGSLSVRGGFSHVNGQTPNVADVYGFNASDRSHFYGASFEDIDQANFGVSWSDMDSGLYLSALYDYSRIDLLSGESGSVAGRVNGVTLSYLDYIQSQGFEFAVGYAFDNGFSALLGYEISYNKAKSLTNSYDYALVRRIPVLINYRLNSNFNVWGEVGIDAGSDRKFSEFKVDKKDSKNVFSLGARYTF